MELKETCQHAAESVKLMLRVVLMRRRRHRLFLINTDCSGIYIFHFSIIIIHSIYILIFINIT